MTIIKSLKSGDIYTVFAAFLYLCISFMAWVSLSPLMIYITKDIDVSTETRLRLSALAVVSGSLLRIPIGSIADKIGTKATGIMVQCITLVSVITVYFIGLKSCRDISIFALCLGFSGASFAVALPQASRWYSKKHQGLILGIVGAGNMGVAFNALYAPYIAEYYDWQLNYGILGAALGVTLLIYIFLAQDAPIVRKQVQPNDYVGVITGNRGRLYMFLYFITFGGFVGLSSSLPTLFNSQYHINGIVSGILAAVTIFVGSIARPIGGYLADKRGGTLVLNNLLFLISLSYALLSTINFSSFMQSDGSSHIFIGPIVSALLFTICSFFLGMGNGAVFQQIGQIFQFNIGAATGIVGAAGGIGGYFLAEVLARSREQTGNFGYGYASLCILALIGLICLKFRAKDMHS